MPCGRRPKPVPQLGPSIDNETLARLVYQRYVYLVEQQRALRLANCRRTLIKHAFQVLTEVVEELLAKGHTVRLGRLGMFYMRSIRHKRSAYKSGHLRGAFPNNRTLCFPLGGEITSRIARFSFSPVARQRIGQLRRGRAIPPRFSPGAADRRAAMALRSGIVERTHHELNAWQKIVDAEKRKRAA